MGLTVRLNPIFDWILVKLIMQEIGGCDINMIWWLDVA